MTTSNRPAPIVREARADDRESVIEFNIRLARETEGKELARSVLTEGVVAALTDHDRLRYWVAEETPGGVLVGQAAISREWSDWRNGWLWWFQSVYVRPESRGRGVFRALHGQIRDLARGTPDVIGLRLYVEHGNRLAQQTYETLGLRPSGYLLLEELWPERFVRPSSGRQAD